MKKRNKGLVFLLSVSLLLILGLVFFFSLQKLDKISSTDSFCMSCHVHPHAEASWRKASHYNTKTGVVVHCVDCHLPPKDDLNYWPEKLKAASRDLYAYWTKNQEEINWKEKSAKEHAKKHTFKSSCLNCHQNLFPLQLSEKGGEAHFYYKQNQDKLHCINCHLAVGHGGKNLHQPNEDFLKQPNTEYTCEEATLLTDFVTYREQIPSTSVTFTMIAIPKGTVQLKGEKKTIPAFFMAETELTWDAYKAFLSGIETEGRTDETEDIDVISGATPPFGDPSQAWGMGQRPAITMTWHAAVMYCKWLSQKTGKTYRLPTAAEWEYASRAGSDDDFFFGGTVADYKKRSFPYTLFQSSDDKIGRYVIWKGNSNGKTGLPDRVQPNAFGLLNTQGNVKEFCSDEYNHPESGNLEHIVKGGSFKSDVEELKLDAVDYTKHDEWMRTDPQIPKSIWWYSDCNDVGFRVVCEWKTQPEE